MQLVDDREYSQQTRLSVLVGGKDVSMSRWGGAKGGISYAYWACAPEDVEQVRAWVYSRSDISNISQRNTLPSGMSSDHCHIYCVESTHPALQGCIPPLTNLVS